MFRNGVAKGAVLLHEKKVDAVKLVQGKPAFTADMDIRGMLYAKVLHSPHAHARIKKIDISKAKELKGVDVRFHEILPPLRQHELQINHS